MGYGGYERQRSIHHIGDIEDVGAIRDIGDATGYEGIWRSREDANKLGMEDMGDRGICIM